MLVAIVRVRGKVDVRKDINDTLNMLNLTENNHCSIFTDNPILRGMLKKAKDYCTWGFIDKDTLKLLLQKRARLEGDKRLTDDFFKANKLTIDKLIDEFEKDPKTVYKLGIKKVFRLSPPSKGFGKVGIKYPFAQKGALGDRKEEINKLLKKMI